jgi:hypothetical protein
MYTGKLVFAQVMEHIPMKVFRRCVQTYNGNHKIKSLSCLDQYLCMAFAQLTYRESLRETVICLRAQTKKLYHMGIQWRHCSQHSVQRQQSTGLENLGRLCRGTDKNRQANVCKRGFGTRTHQYNLRARFFHHRSVSVSFPVGSVSVHQVGRQTSHAARSTRQYSNVYSYLEWKDARCECAGYPDPQSWGFLHHGPGLSGFYKTIQHRSGERVFRHSSKRQYGIQASIFSRRHYRGEVMRGPLRSDYCTHRRQLEERLSSAVATSQILRQQKQQDFQLSDQQF